jgi:hypothetical protein
VDEHQICLQIIAGHLKKAKGIKIPANVNHESKIIVFEIFV